MVLMTAVSVSASRGTMTLCSVILQPIHKT